MQSYFHYAFCYITVYSQVLIISHVCIISCTDCDLSASCSKYDFSTLPPEDDEDYIDMGAAILNFYSSLVDLLGHCAPDAVAIKAGRSDSLRARAILRSLVSMEDLEGGCQSERIMAGVRGQKTQVFFPEFSFRN